jgi:hypothetical protein
MKDLSHAAGRSFAQRTECYINDFLCMQLQGLSGTRADRLHATSGKSVSLMITKWDVKRNREALFFLVHIRPNSRDREHRPPGGSGHSIIVIVNIYAPQKKLGAVARKTRRVEAADPQLHTAGFNISFRPAVPRITLS